MYKPKLEIFILLILFAVICYLSLTIIKDNKECNTNYSNYVNYFNSTDKASYYKCDSKGKIQDISGYMMNGDVLHDKIIVTHLTDSMGKRLEIKNLCPLAK